ncbi:hypothetical protein L7F22_046327 [Adiantum nelumboides]|nr:hypothetical protein [Adiantum nelumboides]
MLLVCYSLRRFDVNLLTVEAMASGPSHDMQRGRDRSRGHSQGRGRFNDKGNRCSKSRGCNMRNVECYYYHKKGHVKKDCYAFQREKGKTLASPSTLVPDVHLQPLDILVFTTDMPYDALLALDDCYAQTWIIDSGASFHVTPHKEWFASYLPMHGSIKLGDSHQLEILGIGDVKVCMANGTQFMLKDVRHVPKLSKSLVSMGQLDELGYTTVFGNGSWLICKANLVILKGQKSGTLYPLYVSLVKENGIYVAETMPSIELWHSRLGHISQKRMKTLQRFGYLPVLNYSDL